MTGKRALCVGINNFKYFPSAALRGCVNDANDMENLLKILFEFQSDNIVKLTDAKATKANIMKNLQEMLVGAKSGKYSHLVFTMSSHGTQVPDLSGDESDRVDEAFCPYDLKEKQDEWDPEHIIVDDELRDMFIQLPDEIVLEVFLDTCHSGTGLKAIDLIWDRQTRYIPPPSLEAFKRVDGKRQRGLNKALLEKGMRQHILWAACRADQTSADANIDGDWHGAFTYYFCKEMKASQNKLTRNEILEKVREDLKEADYTQIPQLECEATVRNWNMD
ncbi:MULTISPECIES: caspase family protein [Methanobacterium]|uniref:Caspase family protein n=1 Tax=Methanobacterium subterraneum TaxID=59277 RepID=A0A2H4VC42_9EURY|nr:MULTISPECIES: caspase family protein [Methanobacterium]MBW4258256.1 caspase family protein [Methanobacterium sp. YSL]AUB55658.1 peptidase C14 [Methanobacterium subterraneum]AUB57356.1 peptidase C14 [Methanobacterium sp. MZ-A1]AUB60479.1 peptidase C14 [Methanobacterium subterraneum]NMO08391.1 caspase family protein [Methanobacterium subterraneum]